MPKFTSEKAKQDWIDKIRATRAANKLKKQVGAPRASGAGIAGAIEEIDSKIAALENVKRNLRHAQELVNL